MSEAFYRNEYLQSLLYYIESNISADIDTGLLSSVGYVSRDKLYSDFYSLSGHSVKEYVRKRRLSNALALIKTSDINLADIAFQCGYSSYLTLWRAVKQTLGLSPSEYKGGGTYYFFPPFIGEPLQSVTVSKKTIPSALRILFYKSRLADIENMAVNAFLQAKPDYSGQIFGRNGKQEGNKFCYELYLTDAAINHHILSSYGFKITNKTDRFAATFAISTVQNSEPKISAAWDYLYSVWLQNSMFEYTGEPYFEEYILKNGKPIKLKLYLPIRERGGDTKITLIDNPELRFITAKAKGPTAEKIASQMIFNHLKAHFPHVINSSKEIYMRKEMNTCVCGVKVNPGLQVKEDKNTACVSTDQRHYLILESSVMGEYDRYADMLSAFANDNGMNVDIKELFAVYDASESFRRVKLKMYCPVKIRTK